MTRSLAMAVALAALTLAATTGCSSSSSSSPSSGGSTAAASTSAGSASSAATGTGTAVTVKETEFKLALSTTAFKPGAYTFVAQDAGTVSHALAIEGPGVPMQQTPILAPGGKADLSVTLKPGSYELWCPVDGHKALGMDTHITVA
ncbi:cupredoxin domain-containing protein [Streptacidiphilus fuscans]|uniref:Copper-binding protein n=1 Tax=Streptacidiphilus fuscans TaxID=2789292 RepID=A0A931FEY2_9ACTN|nr:hypothetical protein [Streptacidiphilus fuscans]MBF9069710.1 hypothetical protein [Streptacidiphilus fuscans]